MQHRAAAVRHHSKQVLCWLEHLTARAGCCEVIEPELSFTLDNLFDYKKYIVSQIRCKDVKTPFSKVLKGSPQKIPSLNNSALMTGKYNQNWPDLSADTFHSACFSVL
jgi:hypothetical protein